MSATPPATPPAIAPIGADLGLVSKLLLVGVELGKLVLAEDECALFGQTVRTAGVQIAHRRHKPWQVLEEINIGVRPFCTSVSDLDGVRAISQAGPAPGYELRELRNPLSNASSHTVEIYNSPISHP